VKRKFPNKKRDYATIMGAPNISLLIVPMKSKTIITKDKKESKTDYKNIKRHMGEVTLDLNETQQKITQVRRMRRLQPWLFTSHPPHQGSSTCSMMTTTPLTFVL
jgi:hypothetical protein